MAVEFDQAKVGHEAPAPFGMLKSVTTRLASSVLKLPSGFFISVVIDPCGQVSSAPKSGW